MMITTFTLVMGMLLMLTPLMQRPRVPFINDTTLIGQVLRNVYPPSRIRPSNDVKAIARSVRKLDRIDS